MARNTPPNLPTSSPSTTTRGSRAHLDAQRVVDRLDDVHRGHGGLLVLVLVRALGARLRHAATRAARAGATAAPRRRRRTSSRAPAAPACSAPRSASRDRLGCARSMSSLSRASVHRPRCAQVARASASIGSRLRPTARARFGRGRPSDRRSVECPPHAVGERLDQRRARRRRARARPPRARPAITASMSLPSTRTPGMP